ncbi:MAG: DUF1289 domain-containing protein [Burkholderiales bacterium]
MTADDSPCIHVCLMDYASGHCIGCYRTLDEITYWITYSAEQKRKILAAAESRRTTMPLSR